MIGIDVGCILFNPRRQIYGIYGEIGYGIVTGNGSTYHIPETNIASSGDGYRVFLSGSKVIQATGESKIKLYDTGSLIAVGDLKHYIGQRVVTDYVHRPTYSIFDGEFIESRDYDLSSQILNEFEYEKNNYTKRAIKESRYANVIKGLSSTIEMTGYYVSSRSDKVGLWTNNFKDMMNNLLFVGKIPLYYLLCDVFETLHISNPKYFHKIGSGKYQVLMRNYTYINILKWLVHAAGCRADIRYSEYLCPGIATNYLDIDLETNVNSETILGVEKLDNIINCVALSIDCPEVLTDAFVPISI